VTVAPATDKITVTATAASNAKISSGTGEKTLKGEGLRDTVVIRLADTLDTETSEYTIYVYRQSSNADLASLKVILATGEVGITPSFDKDVTDYTAGIGDATKVTIDAKAVVATAGLDGIGTSMDIPADKKFLITVSAEAGDNTKVYTVTVTTDAPIAAGVSSVRSLLSVSPNPTSGVVTVDNPSDDEVLVYGVSGTLLLRARGTVLDLTDYPTGAYVITVGGKAAKVVKR
jgi:hypothetical protein